MRISVPGDKSISQRALLLAAVAEGESRLAGVPASGDVTSTTEALRALGVDIGPRDPDDGSVRVRGVGLGGLRAPPADLDLGNSGTGARLLLGVLSGSGLEATLTGDGSLRARPMRRVTEPLERMGAGFEFLNHDGRLPVRVRGVRPLRALAWDSPVASAQVKSALLLAGLTGAADVRVREPRRSRDHTERLLRHLGVSLLEEEAAGGWSVATWPPGGALPPLELTVPGDVSSAAFLLALGALGGAGGELTVEGVGLNPTRTAFLDVLERMGAGVRREVRDAVAGEPVGRITVAPGPLRAVDVGGAEVPALIDELPLVAVLGARAVGVTRIRDAGELRHKESDRITTLVTNLRTLGVTVREHPDGLSVEGSDRAPDGEVRTHGDHRIAMAFGVLGSATGGAIRVDRPADADVSFPGFWTLLEQLGEEVRR